MAGFLDDLLTGEGSALGLGLLAAGGPSTVPMSFGQRLAMGVQQAQAQKDAALRSKLLASQMMENDSQASYRAAQVADMQRKAAALAQFTRYLGGGGQQPGAEPAGMSPPGSMPGAGGPQGVAPMPGAPQPVQALPAASGWSGGGAAGKLTEDVLIGAKLSGLPDLTEIAKMSRPKWEFQGGQWVNTNDPSFKGGMPDMQIMPGPGGQPMIVRGNAGSPTASLVPGSVPALAQIEDTKNRSAAAYTEGSQGIGPDGRMYPRSRLAAVGGGPAGGGAAPQMPSASGPTNVGERGMKADIDALPPVNWAREAQNTRNLLAIPGAITNPDDRRQAEAFALRAETMAQNNAGAPAARAPSAMDSVAGMPAATDFSPKEKAEQAAEQARAIEQAKADVTPGAQKVQKYTAAADAVALIDKALTHPGLPKATGLASWNPINKVPGTEAKDFEVLRDQLKGTAFLSAYNELKGGGAITEVEGRKAEDAIARLNTAQSTKSFKEALGDYKAILKRGMDRSAGTLPAGAVDDLKPAKPGTTMLPNGWTVKVK